MHRITVIVLTLLLLAGDYSLTRIAHAGDTRPLPPRSVPLRPEPLRPVPLPPVPLGFSDKAPDDKLRQQVQRLADALNHRDLAAIRAQIHPTRIYVEVDDKAAYLSHSQTLVVLETFFRNRSSVTSTFDFVSDDGVTGSASGSLSARKDGKAVRYRLNFGFTRTDAGSWLLTRISMR